MSGPAGAPAATRAAPVSVVQRRTALAWRPLAGAGRVGPLLEHERQRRVLLEALADGEVDDEGMPRARQLVGRADARAQQDGRGVDGPGREHDRRRVEFDGAAVDQGGDADRPGRTTAFGPADAVDERPAPDHEVGPAPGRLEVAVVGADAPAAPGVEGERREPGGGGLVAVGHPRVAVGEGGVAQRQVEAAPGLDGRPADRDRTARAVDRLVTEGEVVLEADEVRQHGVRRPPANRPGAPTSRSRRGAGAAPPCR